MRSWMAVALIGGALWAGPARGEGASEHYKESYALEAKGDTAGALAELAKLGGDRSGDYTFQLRHGWLLYLVGRSDEAALAYARAAELSPRSVEARLGAMLPLMAAKRWADAERRADEVLKLAPNDYWALSRLAYIHYQQGRYAKAEAAYKQVLAYYPSNVEMRAGLGWSLLKQGKKEAARNEFEAILAVAPDQASAKEGLPLVH